MGRVGNEKEVAIIDIFGKPFVALIPIEVYEQVVTEREARFQVIDRIRSSLPEIPEEDVEKGINQPISPSQVCRNHPPSGWVKKTGLKVRGCGNGFLTHNPKVPSSSLGPATIFQTSRNRRFLFQFFHGLVDDVILCGYL